MHLARVSIATHGRDQGNGIRNARGLWFHWCNVRDRRHVGYIDGAAIDIFAGQRDLPPYLIHQPTEMAALGSLAPFVGS